MKNKYLLIAVLAAGVFASAGGLALTRGGVLNAAFAGNIPEPPNPKEPPREYKRIVVFSDMHVAPENEAAERAVVNDVNAWKDVDMVAVTGDLCEKFGTRAELSRAAKLLSGLKKPLFAVTGNHDYIYEDKPDRDGNKVKGSEQSRSEKLERFKAALNLPGHYYSRKLGNYLLVFLSSDHRTGKNLTEMTDKQVKWFAKTLANNKKVPTIVFFHGPLKGTLANYNSSANTAGFVAQPADRIGDILRHNSQVVLWVSGHTHTSPSNSSFNSGINKYGKATNIHNAKLESKWTNSLFLYPDRVVVTTYNHKTRAWAKEKRVFRLGQAAANTNRK